MHVIAVKHETEIKGEPVPLVKSAICIAVCPGNRCLRRLRINLLAQIC